jgi:hypothetical protein
MSASFQVVGAGDLISWFFTGTGTVDGLLPVFSVELADRNYFITGWFCCGGGCSPAHASPTVMPLATPTRCSG